MNGWDAGRYERTAGFVPALGLPLVDVLAPVPGERILDLGCGDGRLSVEIASRGAVVVGVDSSPSMVEAARRRGIDARLVDAATEPLGTGFDAVFSNAALHWMRPPEAVATAVAAALRPGGRLVAELGGHGNVAAISVALTAVLSRRGIDAAAVSPWFFPTVDEYSALLAAAGLDIETIESFARPTLLPGSVEDWLEVFARPFFEHLTPEDRPAAVGEVAELLAPWLRDRDGRWTADYVRLRLLARAR